MNDSFVTESMAPFSRACRVLLGAALCVTTACTTVTEVAVPSGESTAGRADATFAVVDGGASSDVWVSDVALEAGPCEPDPCAEEHRECLPDGRCGACLPGWVSDDFGQCAPVGEPCDPDPCVAVNKECIGGFCGECLPGFQDDGAGVCRPPNPCLPNPCVKPNKGTCVVSAEGILRCVCDPGAHDDGLGGCTYDACTPNPCEAPTLWCHPDGLFHQCACPEGSLFREGTCVPDPCAGTPCTAYARSVCHLVDLATGELECHCDEGFVLDPDSDTCVETPVMGSSPGPAPEGDAQLALGERALFFDDWFVASRPGFLRRLHPLTRRTDWIVGPEPAAEDGALGRARAAASLVEVPEDFRLQLDSEHPLRNKAWWLFYMGYRFPFSPSIEPAWLCVVGAENVDGPWESPELLTGSIAPHCMLRVPGAVQAEVSFQDGGFIASVTRIPLGDGYEPGLYVYRSGDGVSWQVASEGPVMALNLEAPAGEVYARIGDKSRLVWDELTQRWMAYVALSSELHGDARGVMVGQKGPTTWPLYSDALEAPGVLGPSAEDLANDLEYGDMVAWRVGSLWVSLFQKVERACPRRAFAALALSRDGRHWWQVRDEFEPSLEAILPYAQQEGAPDANIETLTGGAPLESEGEWHFFVGGTAGSDCDDPATPGGIFRATGRAAGLVSLALPEAESGILTTRPFRLSDGPAAELRIDARVDDKLQVRIEALSPIGSVLESEEVVLEAGDYRDAVVALSNLHGMSHERLRLRLILTAGGELFGFRFLDPLCTPNPCVDDPERGLCDSSTGEALCDCTPPLHADGAGACTEDPCLPDPCTGPYEQGCSVVEELAVCGCETGFALIDYECRPDPCLALPIESLCPLPGPNRCRVVDGLPECFCPEGSVESPTGCMATAPRAFVTSVTASPDFAEGIAAADALCAGQAFSAGFPGQFLAWLSAPGEAAGQRFVGGGPWRTWDPQLGLWTRLVAMDYQDLIDGQLASPIDATEFGLSVASEQSCGVWTATLPNGESPPPVGMLGGSCLSWTSSDSNLVALAGNCHATNGAWTADAPVSCEQALRFYCLQRPDGDVKD